MDLRNYFARVDKPKTAKAGGSPPKEATAAATTSTGTSSTKRKSDEAKEYAAPPLCHSLHGINAYDFIKLGTSSHLTSQNSPGTFLVSLLPQTHPLCSPAKKAAVDPAAFFNANAKINQSSKPVKPVAKPAPSRPASFAKPDDDDEFADFDIDVSQIDASILDAPVSKVPATAKVEAKASPAKKAENPSPPKKAATPIKPPPVIQNEKLEVPVKAEVAKETKKLSPAKVAIKPEEPAPAKKPSPIKPETAVKPVLKKEASSVDTAAADVSSKKANYMKILAKKNSGPAAPGTKEIPVGEENCLANLTFVFTGELSSISRDDAQDLVKRYGGRVTGSVSGKTSYVVVGEEAGASKLTKAASLKVKQLDEDGLFDLIRNAKGKPDPSSKAPATKKSTSSASATTSAAENKAPVAAASSSFYSNKSSVDAKGKAPMTEAARPPLQPMNQSSELWTTKYKPTKYDDVMGNKSNVTKLATWLKNWNASTASEKPAAMKEDPGKSRAILISGPPGIGKTTAAHLVAKLEGFEIVEFNASDTRSKKTVADVVKEMTGSHTLAEYFSKESAGQHKAKRQVLIMDEVDGMSAGDRGGIAELINIIKKSKIPIICICNDRQSPKVKSLVNHCYDMRFMRPKTAEVEKTIKSICQKEGLDLKFNVVDTLVKSTQSDIRQILNMLSTYRLQSQELSFDQSRQLSQSSEKNMAKSPWDVTGTLLNRGSFRDSSFADKLELYFSDFSLIPLMIQENYIKMDPTLAHETGGPTKIGQDIEALNCLANAAESIAFADVVSNVQMKTQNWGLLPFHGVMSTVRPAFFTHGTVVAQNFYGGGFAFPGWLGKNSNQGKNMRLLKEVQMHMRLHVSADKNEVRQSYLPAMAPLLTHPLKESDGATTGIETVIRTMDEYYLTREDWDSILDLGMEECSAKVLTDGIPTAVKTSFTRTYNKTNHPKPFMSASLLGKASRGGGGGGPAPDLEDVVEVDDEVVAEGDEEGDADDDDVGADRLIKQKVARGAAAAAKKASGSGTTAARGGKRAAESAGSSSKGSKKQKK
ncbi:hypothetical protein HDU99_001925 [Rhizoclosmatium hyalinum]|nr:hypothetical protein HDU99_001925 [Rhizoclosmatium hyalinum]